MPKVLGKSGDSIADIYDVAGSIVGIQTLDETELPIVHEMGATIFSERFSTFIRSANSAAVNQSTNWVAIISDLPAHPFRIFAISVFTTSGTRVSLASVAVRDPANGREIPIWIWDATADGTLTALFSDDGAAAAVTTFLQPAPENRTLPQMMAGLGQPQNVRDLAFRGRSTAFGAGTVTTDLLVHIGFSQVGGLSSRGLPIPSW